MKQGVKGGEGGQDHVSRKINWSFHKSQDSFHGELVWKNHDSRLLMKSRFMRKKIGHSRITKIPFAK